MDGHVSLTPPPARLNAFRDTYGDPPLPPDISRKITACVRISQHNCSHVLNLIIRTSSTPNNLWAGVFLWSHPIRHRFFPPILSDY